MIDNSIQLKYTIAGIARFGFPLIEPIYLGFISSRGTTILLTPQWYMYILTVVLYGNKIDITFSNVYFISTVYFYYNPY
jgi:hypothetical protein